MKLLQVEAEVLLVGKNTQIPICMKIRQVQAELLRAELKKNYQLPFFMTIRQVEAELLRAEFKKIINYHFS